MLTERAEELTTKLSSPGSRTRGSAEAALSAKLIRAQAKARVRQRRRAQKEQRLEDGLAALSARKRQMDAPAGLPDLGGRLRSEVTVRRARIARRKEGRRGEQL